LIRRRDELTTDEYALIDTSIKQSYYKNCIEGNVKIIAEEPSAKDVQSEYDRLLFSLHTILIKRRSNLVTKQVNLFTTNMDLFLDWSLEKQNLSYNDGFSGRFRAKFGTVNFHNTIRKTSSHYDYQSEVPHFNLFKLHGSVNWKLERNEVEYDHNLGQLQMISSKKLVTAEILEEIEKSLGDLKNDLTAKGITRSANHDNFLNEYDKLVMINPTKAKFETTTRDLTFYELLRMYSNHLERENSILFVIGFSFADEHIREITKRVAASNPTLLIVIFAYDSASHGIIKNHLNEYSNIKYIFDSTDATKYSLKKINEEFFSKLANELNKEGAV
jgi:hypothetical protein